MPTPTGLPKVGEVWEKTIKLPPRRQGEPWETTVIRFVVLERGRGDYWSLKVYVPGLGRDHWVDPAYYFGIGQLKYIGSAGPNTKKKLGLS